MKKIILSAFIAISALFSFTGCYDAIFNSIRNEVPLEDGEINGFINSIVRYKNPADNKEYLYLQNGLIYYKKISDENGGLTANASHGTWTKDSSAPEGITYSYFDSKFNGVSIFKLASDSTYLYALGWVPEYDQTSSRNVPDKFMLYCLDTDGQWKTADTINEIINSQYTAKLSSDYYMMDASIQLFCTNTPQNAHRKAYIRIGGGSPYNSDYSDTQEYGSDFKNGNCGIIELNGPSTGTENFITKGTGNIGSLSGTGAGKKTLSAVYMNSKIYFMDYLAASTNETKSDQPTYVYYGNGKILYSFAATDADTLTDDSGNLITTEGCAAEIISLCPTADSVVLGTYENGAYRVLLTDGKPATATSSFTTNAASVMYSPYIVRMLFCTDPSINETSAGSALYSSLQFRYTESAASAAYSNVGLWSYYASRGNWNKE